MYVDTMSLCEITKEMKKDNLYLSSIIEHVVEDPTYRRVCLKMKGESIHSFNRVDFKSKETGFEYHIIPYTYGKSSFRKIGLGIVPFMTFRFHNRIWAASLGHNGEPPILFTPHFFDRYNEREGKGSNDILDLMTKFFIRNQAFVYRDYKHPSHPNSLFYTMDEGVGLGSRLDSDTVMMTTYIRRDMLRGNQIDIRKEEESDYKKLIRIEENLYSPTIKAAS